MQSAQVPHISWKWGADGEVQEMARTIREITASSQQEIIIMRATVC